MSNTPFDFTGNYNGLAIGTGAVGTLVVSTNSPGAPYKGILSWSTVGTTVNGTLFGSSTLDPGDPIAGYIELAGYTSGVIGTASVVGYTENYQGSTPGVGLQFIVRITWAQAVSGGAHDLNSEVATFTRT